MKIKLDGVMETLLITLFFRAKDYEAKNSVLKDKLAYQIKSKIDYDFSKLDKVKMSYYGTLARAKTMDLEAEKFIENHPDCVVVSIGSGLDTRFFRIDNGQITWYNVDFDEVIALRENLIPAHDRVINIRKSALDPDWTKQVETGGKDLLILSEGVLMYLSEKEIKDLLFILTSSFSAFTCHLDMISYKMVGKEKKHDAVKAMQASFRYGVKDGRELLALNPNLRWAGCINFTDQMKPMLKGLDRLFTPFIYKWNNRLCMYAYTKQA